MLSSSAVEIDGSIWSSHSRVCVCACRQGRAARGAGCAATAAGSSRTPWAGMLQGLILHPAAGCSLSSLGSARFARAAHVSRGGGVQDCLFQAYFGILFLSFLWCFCRATACTLPACCPSGSRGPELAWGFKSNLPYPSGPASLDTFPLL